MLFQEQAIWLGIVALAGALLPLPQAYYAPLLGGIFCLFAYFACAAWLSKKQGLTWVLGLTAVVFNPFVTLDFAPEAWMVIDSLAIGLLLYLRSQKFEIKLNQEE